MSGIRIKAMITLLAPAEGGRTSPITGSYRPNHNFGDPDNREMATGFIDLAVGEMLQPGQSKTIEMTLWTYPGLAQKVVAGREWRIQEGAKLMGVGKVVEVLQ